MKILPAHDPSSREVRAAGSGDAPPWLYRSEAFAEDVLDLVAPLPQSAAGAMAWRVEEVDARGSERKTVQRGLVFRPRLGWQGA